MRRAPATAARRASGRLRLVGQQRALAAGLGDARDPLSRRPPPASEDLERLDELVEVADLDRRVSAEHCRERALGPDERSGVRERCTCGRLRASHLEADDGLAGVGAPLQSVDERLRAPDGLQEEADRWVLESSAKKARKSAASVTASAPEDTTQRSPMRPPRERNASAIDPTDRGLRRAPTQSCPGDGRSTRRRRRGRTRPCSWGRAS